MRLWLIVFLILPSVALADLQVTNGKVDARINSEPLNQVIQQFRSQTKIQLVMEDSIGNQDVSAEFRNLTIAAAVKKILEGTGINYVVIGNDDGSVSRIFIGTAKPAGVPMRRLDNRPVNAPQGRGLVTPVNPAPAQQIPPVQPEPPARNSPVAPAVEVPTGGGYVPATPQKEAPPENQENPDQQQNDEEQ